MRAHPDLWGARLGNDLAYPAPERCRRPPGHLQRRKPQRSTAFADSRRLAKEGRWESMGNHRVSKGGRSQTASVVSGDGQAWGSGLRSIAPPSDTAGNSRGRAADGGNRADRRDNRTPGRALAPVRAPVRKIAGGFHCHRNCANDRSGLTGDVRRADVFVRPVAGREPRGQCDGQGGGQAGSGPRRGVRAVARPARPRQPIFFGRGLDKGP